MVLAIASYQQGGGQGKILGYPAIATAIRIYMFCTSSCFTGHIHYSNVFTHMHLLNWIEHERAHLSADMPQYQKFQSTMRKTSHICFFDQSSRDLN